MGRAAQKERRLTTREEIVRVGTDIIGRHGFNHTGLDAILKAAGVPKGSFYHYFGSKEDFGLAVIDEFAAEYEKKLDAVLTDASVAPLARMRKLFDASIDGYETDKCKRGCLIGTLGQEMAGQHERFRERLDTVFKRWEARFAACLDEARKAGVLPAATECDQLAKVVLSGWEGAILRAKVTKSVRPMQDYVSVLFERVLR